MEDCAWRRILGALCSRAMLLPYCSSNSIRLQPNLSALESGLPLRRRVRTKVSRPWKYSLPVLVGTGAGEKNPVHEAPWRSSGSSQAYRGPRVLGCNRCPPPRYLSRSLTRPQREYCLWEGLLNATIAQDRPQFLLGVYVHRLPSFP